jgi:hypothetical protein
MFLSRKESAHGKSLPDRKWEEKRWTVEEKVQIVRRSLRDHVGLGAWRKKQAVCQG